MENNEHTMLSLPKPTYELWFLGDMVGEPQPKNRATLNALLQEGIQMLTDAASVGGVVGEVEIVHRWAGQNEPKDETVWNMSIDEFKKVIR
jgi:hypothetical protein